MELELNKKPVKLIVQTLFELQSIDVQPRQKHFIVTLGHKFGAKDSRRQIIDFFCLLTFPVLNSIFSFSTTSRVPTVKI